MVALSLSGFAVFWAVLALVKADPQILPGPVEVLRLNTPEAASGELWHHMAATLRRVALAFVIAMVAGAALGLLLGRMPNLARWVDPWVTVFLNLPALVVIVLCYLWTGLNETAAIAAVSLNKTAMVVVAVSEDVRAFDPAVDDMARVYRFFP